MRDITKLLALPASVLSVIANSAVYAQELPWPYNLPRDVRYFPEHEAHMKRELEAQEKLAWGAPVGARKMSGDDEEKFFLHYWTFDDDENYTERGGRKTQSANSSNLNPLLPGIAPHSDSNGAGLRLFGRDVFARDFKCPSGTNSCNSIGQPDLCCNVGETCISTSEGYGCCPAGESCGDEVSGCTDGYTSCPNSSNGGCCVPGAKCEGSGCVLYSTGTVTLTLSTVTHTTGASFTTETSSGRTVTIAFPTTETKISDYTTTETVISDHTTTLTVLVGTTKASSLVCSAGYFSCPALLGGGCCHNGQACVSSRECSDISTSTTSANPPTLKSSISVSAASQPTTSGNVGCPTGFYMCSARYLGGCCRVDKNCETTHCPAADSTVLVTSGVTVVASATTNVKGSCANGWFSCPPLDNGGCCPSGYQCGAGSSCTATNPGQRNTAKMAPSNANVVRWAWGLLTLGLTAGVGMVLL